MDKKHIRQYMLEIWNQALEESLNKLEIPGERVKLIIQFVLAVLILGAIFAFSFLGIAEYQNFSNVIKIAVIEVVVSSLIIFLGLLYGAKIIALWNVFRIAAERDYRQLEQIKKLEPDDPFEFILKPPLRVEGGVIWVGIDIYNNSTHAINCSVSVKTEKMRRQSILEPLTNNPGSPDPFQISRNTNYPFYFACSSKGWECAVLNTREEEARRIYNGKHELSIIINGESQKGEPLSHIENYILIFDGDDKLKLIPSQQDMIYLND